MNIFNSNIISDSSEYNCIILEYQDLIDELNHMPLTSQTLRVRNRQIEIEKELRKLDVTIQIFSRSRVYVKNED